MAAITDVVMTERIPLGNWWMLTGYGTATTDSYVPKETMRIKEILHVVYASGRSTITSSNLTSAVENSQDGSTSSLGDLWLGGVTTVVTDFCVIGR